MLAISIVVTITAFKKGVEETLVNDTVVIAHASNTKESYTRYVSRGNEVLRDNITGKETILKYTDSKNIRSSPIFKENEGISEEYEVDDTNIIDPISLGYVEDIPNTFKMTLNEINSYIQEMLNIGWQREGSFCTKTECEFFLKYKGNTLRIVSNGTTVKIINNFSGKIYSPKTYITE